MDNFYFDAVVFLTIFPSIGHFLEALSKAKTGDAVASLGALQPQTRSDRLDRWRRENIDRSTQN